MEYDIPDEHPSDNWESYLGGFHKGTPDPATERKTPMIECPNCGKHELTIYRKEKWDKKEIKGVTDFFRRFTKRLFTTLQPTLRREPFAWYSLEGHEKYWKCQECKLKESVE